MEQKGVCSTRNTVTTWPLNWKLFFSLLAAIRNLCSCTVSKKASYHWSYATFTYREYKTVWVPTQELQSVKRVPTSLANHLLLFPVTVVYSISQVTFFFFLPILCWRDYQAEAWAKRGKTKHSKREKCSNYYRILWGQSSSCQELLSLPLIIGEVGIC